MHFTHNASMSAGPLGRLRLLGRRTPFTQEEVRQRLQLERADHPRTAAVHATAAQTGIWLGLLSDKLALELGRASQRLPSVIYWYTQGVPAHEIGRRITPFGSTWDADRALSVATALIAETLNRTNPTTQAAA